MVLDFEYELKVMIADVKAGIYGDIYDDFHKFRCDHPFASYVFVYSVIDRNTGLVADGFEDCYETPEDALQDYFKKGHKQ